MGNAKIQLGTGEVLLDLTGDTITAAGLLHSMIAHGKDGESVTGELTDGINKYYSSTFEYNNQAMQNRIWDLGFVPNFFLCYRTGSFSIPTDGLTVVALILSKGIQASTYVSDLRAGIYAYTGSGGTKYVTTYTTPSVQKYSSGNTRGIIADMSGTSQPQNYKLNGTYRVIAIGTYGAN